MSHLPFQMIDVRLRSLCIVRLGMSASPTRRERTLTITKRCGKIDNALSAYFGMGAPSVSQPTLELPKE
jgi:hypothetical protein